MLLNETFDWYCKFKPNGLREEQLNKLIGEIKDSGGEASGSLLNVIEENSIEELAPTKDGGKCGAVLDHTCRYRASIDIEFKKIKEIYRILRAKRAKYKK